MPQVAGLIRLALGVMLGSLLTKGILTPDQLEQITSLIVSLLGIVAVGAWSVVSNSLKKMLEQVVKNDEVKEIITDADLANSIPDAKVVPADPAADLH